MGTVIPAPMYQTLPVVGSHDTFPVRRVYCVGRNYAEHAKEMGFSGREDPFFFSKPADALLPIAQGENGLMPYPSKTSDVHHEVELVVVLGKGGRNLSLQQAADCVWGYAIGLDMTRRDLQAEAKKLGRPWETAKGFDFSGPVGPVHPRALVGTLESGAITLTVNGKVTQTSDLSQMIWNVAESIAYLSGLFELKAGDAIFTGTPEGVGAVSIGDTLTASIAGLGEMTVTVGAAL